MRWQRKVIIGAIIMIAVLVVLGQMLSPPNCYTIGNCKSCWSNIETFGHSDYCPNASACQTVPYIDQHNALVDAITCACTDAEASQYSDPELNNNINSLYRTLTGMAASTQDICGGDNSLASTQLIKMYYG